MKLSKMVEENITSEEIEIIEEKKKCNKKKKLLVEEGMKYCSKCGTEYSEELEACPSCEATETFSKCESIDLRIAKKEAVLTAGSSEDEAKLTTEITALKARKESECSEEETPMEEAKTEKAVILLEETCEDCGEKYSSEEKECPNCKNTMAEAKEDKKTNADQIKELESIIANLHDVLNKGQEAQANNQQPETGFESAQEALLKAENSLKKLQNLKESEEVIVEADILVETAKNEEEAAELAYLKSLSGQ